MPSKTDFHTRSGLSGPVVLAGALLCALGATLASAASAADSASVAERRSAQRPIAEIPVPFGMQDIAFDATHHQLFVHYVRKVGGQELAGLARYDLRSPAAPKLLDTLQENNLLGHQGLSLEHVGEAVRLWGSMGQEQGRYAIRFRYQPGGAPADVEQYKLFGDGFIDINVTMPKVCLKEKLLIARGRKSSRTQIIRVFDLQQIGHGGGKDKSASYRNEWTIDPRLFRDGFPLQGIACNEQDGTIHLVAGKSNLAADKRVYVYDFEGRLLRTDEGLSVGLAEAAMENGSYEPEGMIYYPTQNHTQEALVLSVVSGRGKQKVMRLWPIDTAARR